MYLFTVRFNPRTRVGCDLYNILIALSFFEFQSTHPRGVRHSAHHGACIDKQVSIHAPAWGATSWARTPSCCALLFQSTHPRGVRRRPHGSGLASGGFNPRTRVGCDMDASMPSGPPVMFQSTHPRGVRRRNGSRRVPDAPRFNPRTRVGCDCRGYRQETTASKFQSTHPRGVRPGARYLSSYPHQFQSTHPRGVRPIMTVRT